MPKPEVVRHEDSFKAECLPQPVRHEDSAKVVDDSASVCQDIADFEERWTKQGSPHVCSVKDFDGTAFTNSLERIELKLEDLAELPSKLQTVSRDIENLHNTLQGMQSMQKIVKAPVISARKQPQSRPRSPSTSRDLRRGMSWAGSTPCSENSAFNAPTETVKSPGAMHVTLQTVQSQMQLEMPENADSGHLSEYADTGQDDNERGSIFSKRLSSRSNKSVPEQRNSMEIFPHGELQSPTLSNGSDSRAAARERGSSQWSSGLDTAVTQPRGFLSKALTRDTGFASISRALKQSEGSSDHRNAGGAARERFGALQAMTKMLRGGSCEMGHQNDFSLGDEDEEGAADIHAYLHGDLGFYQFTIRPDSRRRALWDVLLIISMALNAMVVSFGLVYNNDDGCLCNSPTATVIMHTADVLWLLGIPVNFLTGFVQKNGQVVLAPGRIARNYVRAWFLFDLLTLWPRVLLPQELEHRWYFGSSVLLRLLRLWPLLERLQRTNLQKQGLILKTILAVTLPAHLMACCWRLATRADGAGEGPVTDWWPVFIEDSYWVLMTMTTVGYGDISPQGIISRLFAICAMLISTVFFGTMVSLTSQAISKVFDDPDERRVACALRFMRRRGVQRELISKVEHTLRRVLQRSKHKTMDSELFRLLTPAVQRELALSLLQEVVLQFPLFQGVNRSFVGELAQAQVWMQCSHGDVVAEDGQLTREVAFVVQGRLSCIFGPRSDGKHLDMRVEFSMGVRPSIAFNAHHDSLGMSNDGQEQRRSKAVDQVIETGGWFGETCLFDDSRIRTATIVATEESDLAILHREDFFQIIQRYPRLSERHAKLKTAMDQGKLFIEELGYRSRAT